MNRALRSTLVALALTFVFAGSAQAAGGNYVIEGGSPAAQAQVRAALDASSFNWSRVPEQITVQITNCACTGAKQGVVVLDEHVLTDTTFGPQYSWGLVQHEFAHQIDFFLLTKSDRKALRKVLGGRDWCYEIAGLSHDEHGCERFAEFFAWAYWPTANNVQRSEAQAVAPKLKPAQFRSLVTKLLAS